MKRYGIEVWKYLRGKFMFEFIYLLLKMIRKFKRKIYLKRLIAKGLKIGKNVIIVEDFFFDPSHCYLISIEDNCTICPNVRIIAHDASIKKILGYTKIGKVEIKKNCFIGDSVIILPGVSIGPNSIVGAGSIVIDDIPANSVAVGNPAKVICSLDEYIRKIKKYVKKKESLRK